jgi:PAS domain S-box-containing protein
LRESEEKYRLLVENSLQGYAVMQNRRCVYCNDAFAKITGYSVEELLSFSSDEIASIMHIEDQELFRKRYFDQLTGKPLFPQRFECRLIRKDGSERWVEVSAISMEYDGKPAGQVVHFDITDRKRTEEALRQSERLLNDILDGSPIPQFVIGRDHRIIKWNKALEEYSGIRAEDAVGTDQQWRPFYEERRPLMADLLLDGAIEKVPE